ncbi:MAG: DUF5060 domain-containing protein [Synoicihabitans sp.]
MLALIKSKHLKVLFASGLVLVGLSQLAAQHTVEQWHPLDIDLYSSSEYINPYQDVGVWAEFVGPNGQKLSIPGFYRGEDRWTIRFSPTAIGRWQFATSSGDEHLNGQSGEVICRPNTNPRVHGGIQIDQDHPRHFRFEDGTRFFLLGTEINWLGLVDMTDPNIVGARQILDMYAEHGFNTVLLNAYANDTRWRTGHSEPTDWGPPTLHAWPGSPGDYDHSRLHPDYWDHFDKVVHAMFERGMNAYLYFKVYNKLVDWPAKGSPEDHLYFSHVVARYQAYPNIIWSFSKESYYEPDHAYIRQMLELIKAEDAYQRLRTTHDDNGLGIDFAFVGDHSDILDFYTDQTQGDIYNNSIEDYLRKEWPISNMEPGYQGGNDGTSSYQGDNISAEKLLKRIYTVIMAGGYATYYYTWHAWDVVRTDEKPEGLVYYKYLAEFFARTNWYRLSPVETVVDGPHNHCLSEKGREYIVYLGEGGTTTLPLENSETAMRGIWMNALTGEEQVIEKVTGASIELTSPWPGSPTLVWIN